MEDIDLSGVDPTRWPEIRRRVEILDEYCTIPERSQRSRRAFAQRLGLGEAHFSYLAQIWRERRNPADLPGAQAHHQPKPGNRLPVASTNIARDVIADLGAMARRRDVLVEVTRRCAEAGIVAPSNATITNMLAAARAQLDQPTTFEPEILIDSCAAKLPAAHGEGVILPRLLVAVQLPERVIVAYEMSLDPAVAPSVEGLMSRLRAAGAPEGQPMRIRAPHLGDIEQAAIGAIVPPGRPAGLPTLPQLLGPAIGGVGIVFQLSRAKPAERLAKVRNVTALSAQDVRTAIDHAVAAHNGRRPPAASFTLADQPLPEGRPRPR